MFRMESRCPCCLVLLCCGGDISPVCSVWCPNCQENLQWSDSSISRGAERGMVFLRSIGSKVYDWCGRHGFPVG